MGAEKCIFLLVAIFCIVSVLIPCVRLVDPLCEGVPVGQVVPFPHETNCSLYYECIGGEKELLMCPDGLFYNERIQSCDIPEVSGCTHKHPLCVGLPPGQIVLLPHERNCSFYYECLDGQLSLHECPGDYYYNENIQSCDIRELSGCTNMDPLCLRLPEGEIFLLPHETNCSLYYKCQNGKKTNHMCEDGLYFNNRTHSCDFPAVSGCINVDPLCDGIDLDYFPHPENCTLYIECYEEQSYVMTCPIGQWFDSKTKDCVAPGESDCIPPTTTPATTPHPSCSGIGPDQTVLIRYEGSCRRYWKCSGSELTLETCPWTLWFDEGRQTCDFPDAVDCDGTTGSPDFTTATPPSTTPPGEDPRCGDDPGISYWPHPVNCEKYIECYDNKSFEMTCPAGFHFDDALKKCVDPNESNCGKIRSTVAIQPDEDSLDSDCLISEGLLLSYPGDCTKFYECVEGLKLERTCPESLWFSEKIQECDYPYLVSCPYKRHSFLDVLKYYFGKKLR